MVSDWLASILPPVKTHVRKSFLTDMKFNINLAKWPKVLDEQFHFCSTNWSYTVWPGVFKWHIRLWKFNFTCLNIINLCNNKRQCVLRLFYKDIDPDIVRLYLVKIWKLFDWLHQLFVCVQTARCWRQCAKFINSPNMFYSWIENVHRQSSEKLDSLLWIRPRSWRWSIMIKHTIAKFEAVRYLRGLGLCQIKFWVTIQICQFVNYSVVIKKT